MSTRYIVPSGAGTTPWPRTRVKPIPYATIKDNLTPLPGGALLTDGTTGQEATVEHSTTGKSMAISKRPLLLQVREELYSSFHLVSDGYGLVQVIT